MPTLCAGRSSSTTTATTTPSPSASSNPPGATPASTTSSTSTANSLAKPSSKQAQKTIWQILKTLVPSSGAIQIFIGLVGLILTILGIKWAVQTYNMARWTELKDFRDDCRSAQASGNSFSKACEEALHKELRPPPYAPSSYFSRSRKRDIVMIGWKEEIYPVLVELERVLVICRKGLLRGVTALLLKVQSLDGTKAGISRATVTVWMNKLGSFLEAIRSLDGLETVTKSLLDTWRKTTSFAEHVGISRANLTFWMNKSSSWMISFIGNACTLLLSTWHKALLIQPLLLSASQFTIHQMTGLAHHSQALPRTLWRLYSGLAWISQETRANKFVSFCLHPWTFDYALIITSAVRYFQYDSISGFQCTLFVTIPMINQLLFWPFWCNDCQNTWWRIITLLTDSTCFTLIFAHFKYIDREYDVKLGRYPSRVTRSMLWIELEYELLLLVYWLNYSLLAFSILFGTAVFMAIWFFHNSRKKTLDELLVGGSILLATHILQTSFIIASSTLAASWRLLNAILLTCGKIFFWVSYISCVGGLFTLSVKRNQGLARR